MGIHWSELHLLDRALLMMGVSMDAVRIAELGAQTVGSEISGAKIPGSEYFAPRCVGHVSFDWSGRYGSEIVDLQTPVDEQWKDQFDVVTNFGTGEHVGNQYGLWANIYDMLVPGGAVVTAAPLPGTWAGHCEWRYPPEFFEQMIPHPFSRLWVGYDDRRGVKRRMLQSILILDEKLGFLTPEEFSALPIDRTPGDRR